MNSLPDGLDLVESSKRVIHGRLDHFPPLAMYKSLENSETKIAARVLALGLDGRFDHETLSMPKSAFGLRPVTLLSPTAGALYGAIVASIADELPSPSRASGAWTTHREFGLDDPSNYIVDMDFAACYEYVDHYLLRSELLLRTSAAGRVDALGQVLDRVSKFGRGLPQMLDASDRLADTYLSILDRRLIREGWSLNRYADDVRVVTSTWDSAHDLIETAAEYARDLGLILAGGKTRIWKAATLVSDAAVQADVFSEFFKAARSDLTKTIYEMTNSYEVLQTAVEPSRIRAVELACRRLLEQWYEGVQGLDEQSEQLQVMGSFVPLALRALRRAQERLPNKLLSEIVFRAPLRLEDVCNYIVARGRIESFRNERHWSSVATLVEMGRQSPWAKLWLLYAATQLPKRRGSSVESVVEWVVGQLKDRHEVVRGEAAWSASVIGRLPHAQVPGLYMGASELTQTAVAAAAGRDPDLSAKVRNAIRDDSPLNRLAFDWAQR